MKFFAILSFFVPFANGCWKFCWCLREKLQKWLVIIHNEPWQERQIACSAPEIFSTGHSSFFIVHRSRQRKVAIYFSHWIRVYLTLHCNKCVTELLKPVSVNIRWHIDQYSPPNRVWFPQPKLCLLECLAFILTGSWTNRRGIRVDKILLQAGSDWCLWNICLFFQLYSMCGQRSEATTAKPQQRLLVDMSVFGAAGVQVQVSPALSECGLSEFPDNSKSCGNYNLHIWCYSACLIGKAPHWKEFYLVLFVRIKRDPPAVCYDDPIPQSSVLQNPMRLMKLMISTLTPHTRNLKLKVWSRLWHKLRTKSCLMEIIMIFPWNEISFWLLQTQTEKYHFLLQSCFKEQESLRRSRLSVDSISCAAYIDNLLKFTLVFFVTRYVVIDITLKTTHLDTSTFSFLEGDRPDFRSFISTSSVKKPRDPHHELIQWTDGWRMTMRIRIAQKALLSFDTKLVTRQLFDQCGSVYNQFRTLGWSSSAALVGVIIVKGKMTLNSRAKWAWFQERTRQPFVAFLWLHTRTKSSFSLQQGIAALHESLSKHMNPNWF